MPTYLIEREIPGAGQLTHDELRGHHHHVQRRGRGPRAPVQVVPQLRRGRQDLLRPPGRERRRHPRARPPRRLPGEPRRGDRTGLRQHRAALPPGLRRRPVNASRALIGRELEWARLRAALAGAARGQRSPAPALRRGGGRQDAARRGGRSPAWRRLLRGAAVPAGSPYGPVVGGCASTCARCPAASTAAVRCAATSRCCCPSSARRARAAIAPRSSRRSAAASPPWRRAARRGPPRRPAVVRRRDARAAGGARAAAARAPAAGRRRLPLRRAPPHASAAAAARTTCAATACCARSPLEPLDERRRRSCAERRGRRPRAAARPRRCTTARGASRSSSRSSRGAARGRAPAAGARARAGRRRRRARSPRRCATPCSCGRPAAADDARRRRRGWRRSPGRASTSASSPRLGGEAGLAELLAAGCSSSASPAGAAFRHPLVREARLRGRPVAAPPGAAPRARRGAGARAAATAGEVAGHWLAARDPARALDALRRAIAERAAVHAYRDADRGSGARRSSSGPRASARPSGSPPGASTRAAPSWPATSAEAARAQREVVAARRADGGGRALADAERRMASIYELQGDRERALAARRVAAEAFAANGLPGEAAAERLVIAGYLQSAGPPRRGERDGRRRPRGGRARRARRPAGARAGPRGRRARQGRRVRRGHRDDPERAVARARARAHAGGGRGLPAARHRARDRRRLRRRARRARHGARPLRAVRRRGPGAHVPELHGLRPARARRVGPGDELCAGCIAPGVAAAGHAGRRRRAGRDPRLARPPAPRRGRS